MINLTVSPPGTLMFGSKLISGEQWQGYRNYITFMSLSLCPG